MQPAGRYTKKARLGRAVGQKYAEALRAAGQLGPVWELGYAPNLVRSTISFCRASQ
jgi:hypothetical protein